VQIAIFIALFFVFVGRDLVHIIICVLPVVCSKEPHNKLFRGAGLINNQQMQLIFLPSANTSLTFERYHL